MTAALSDLHPPPDGWTTDDLDALPDDGYRRELMDGVLLVSPSPTDIHQAVVWRLTAALEGTCPDDYNVNQGVEVRISRQRSFIPDVLVTTDEAAQRGSAWYEPHEVMLAVEVVSRGSQVMDRITKPALYAHTGIPFYWRIEIEGRIVVHTHKLDSDHEIYVPTGQWSDVVTAEEPWKIHIPITRITPRHYPAG